MENLKNRFQYLDERLLPYLNRVLEKLPDAVRDCMLSDRSFQMIADDELSQACAAHLTFSRPVQLLVAINTRILREPGYRIQLAIASQIACCLCLKEKHENGIKNAEALLLQWGFTKELEAVRQDEAISKSEGYQVGYRWAKQQNPDYLEQHFGIYAGDWYARAWMESSHEALSAQKDPATTASILEEVIRLRSPDDTAISLRTKSTSSLSRRMVLAGIMAAIKEMQDVEQDPPLPCKPVSD